MSDIVSRIQPNQPNCNAAIGMRVAEAMLNNTSLPSRNWPDCIKKVWEVDPLECPKCGAEMKNNNPTLFSQKSPLKTRESPTDTTSWAVLVLLYI